MPLTKTRALMADLAGAMNLPGLPADDGGGWQIGIGEDVTVQLFGGDDATLLAVAPVGALAPQTPYATVVYLFQLNGINSEIAPFRIGLDPGGTLILWARLPIAEITGESLANALDAVSDQVAQIRRELAGEADADVA